MKNCSAPLYIRGMQTKTTLKFNLTLARMTIKKPKLTKTSEDAMKRNPYTQLVGMDITQSLRKTVCNCLKN
jgi:hypothetical protein